jgi:FkbM family methyltransferase
MDIGANVGTDCLLALKRGAFVHAFEPSEPIFNVLAINVYLNGFSRRARLNTVVVADRTGVVDFFESPVGASGLSSLRATESLQQRRTQMTSTTLDDYVEQNDIQHVKLLKIDIEGGELVVFQGARDVLENGVVDVIQWESNYRASSAERAQTVNLLDAHGYTSFGFDARRRLVPWSGQPECVSVRRDRLQLVSMFHDTRV